MNKDNIKLGDEFLGPDGIIYEIYGRAFNAVVPNVRASYTTQPDHKGWAAPNTIGHRIISLEELESYDKIIGD